MFKRIARNIKYTPYFFEAFYYLIFFKVLFVLTVQTRHQFENLKKASHKKLKVKRKLDALTSYKRKLLGSLNYETSNEKNPKNLVAIMGIERSVCTLHKYLPYKFLLATAMAAQKMLNRRGIDNTLYYVIKVDQNQSSLENLVQHFWIRSGDYWLIGRKPTEQYKVTANFASLPYKENVILRSTSGCNHAQAIH